MGHKLAIDFGTTNSVVARWDDQTSATEVLAIPHLSVCQQDGRRPLIPSLLYVQDGRSGRVTVGQAVLDQGLERQRANRLFRNFKRGITAGPVLEPRIIDGTPWTDQDAGRCFLRELIQAVPLPAEEIEQLVVTVPVAAFDGYVAWLSEALQDGPLERGRIVDESTAAALGYAITDPDALVMVVDFGGGSLDLSLVQLPQSGTQPGSSLGRLLGRKARQRAARVIAKAGVNLGGSDVDQWLLAEVLGRAALSVQDLGRNYAPLLAECEQAKIALSTVETATVNVESEDGRPHAVSLRRHELEALLEQRGFFATLREAVEHVLSFARQRGVYREDIHHVLLVGHLA
jgi:molecular chaperone DnaK (HSP70)